MEETQEASQESEDSVVTDDMLNRAADGVDEVEEVATEDETTEETTEAEEVAEEEATETEEEATEEVEDVPEEPVDNAERSRMGRRMTELEDNNRQANEKVAAALEQLNTFLGKKEDTEEEEFFELPETREDFARVIKEQLEAAKNEEVTQTTQATNDYEDGYIDTIKDLLEDEPDKVAIFKIIDDEFNVKHSKVDNIQNGMKDAARNVLAAKTKFMKGFEKTIPLKGEKGKKLGGGGGDVIPKVAQKMPKLDAAAAQFVKDTNMSPEKVIKVFG